MSSVTELTSDNFEATISEGVTLIDFMATWCPPCKIIAPSIEQLAQEYEGKARVVQINIDNEQAITERFKVTSVPTMVVLKDGKETARVIGATGSTKSELASALDAATD